MDELRDLSALILAVPHREYDALDPSALSGMMAPDGVIVDVKSGIDPAALREDINYWSL
jgi:UDP-N-acetyl-D-galactosamine dehydrogenase